MEGIVISEESSGEPIQNMLSKDVVMAISDFVDSISANPGTARSDPGTSQSWVAEMHVEVFAIREIPSWVQPMMRYLAEGVLPQNETEARAVQRKAKSYTIINCEVYRQSITRLLQRCVEPAAGQEILLDLHQGECGHHVSSRALV